MSSSSSASPQTARAVVEAAYSTDRSYVEIVAGDHRDGHRVSTDVGVSVVDTREGRVLVDSVESLRRGMGVDLHIRHTVGDRHRDRAAHRHAARRAVVPPPAVDPRLRLGPENGTPAMASDSLNGTTSISASRLQRRAMPIVRVAVLAAGDAGGRITDMALPTELPLREILPAVRRMALTADVDDTGHTVPLSLAPIGGAPFSLDATLNTVGVVDGDLLALQPVPAGPPAPRIVEDIARCGGDLLGGAGKAMGRSSYSARCDYRRHRPDPGRDACSPPRTASPPAASPGSSRRAALRCSTVLATMLAWGRTPKLATALSITALVPIAAALGLAVPGESGASQILLAAAGVTAWSIVSITVAERAIAVFTAVTVIGVGDAHHRGRGRDLGAGHRRHRLGVDRACPSGHRAGRATVRDVVAPTGAGDSRAR